MAQGRKNRPNPDQRPFSFMVPESTWVVPQSPPDLIAAGVKAVVLDLETRDDGLAGQRGPAWPYKGGHVAGVAAAWAGGATYLPIAHPETECLDAEAVGRWLKDLTASGITLVAHNAPYDWGWIGAEWGLTPPARPEDTIAMAVMLDENRLSYSLDNLCIWQGLPGKDESLLLDAGQALGFPREQVKSNLWRLPAKYVGTYAEQDATATLALWEQLRPQIAAQGLTEAYALECDLIPMTVEMRRRGIRIDVERADRVNTEFFAKRDAALAEITAGVKLPRAAVIEDVRSPKWLEATFTSAGIKFARTAKTGQGSFESEWMEEHPHWLPRAVARARAYQQAADKFISGFILGYAHRGRIHAEIHAYRSDDGGTRSHRFSYSDPPLQQMPSPKRDREIGLACRTLFLPEQGDEWLQVDYSQQEYRLIVHFATLMGLPRADVAAGMYESDPKTSFHRLVAEWTGLDAKSTAKDCNFAKAYGAGVPKFATMIKKSREEAKAIYEKYDRELPFVSALGAECTQKANARGFIRLIDGARCRFETWEPGWGYSGPYHGPAPWEIAKARIDNPQHDWFKASLRRAFTHKAMNRLIQGSAARQTKLAMRALWQQGIVPMLQMHDELDVSIADRALVAAVRDTMVSVVPLKVPMMAEASVGPNWGETEDV